MRATDLTLLFEYNRWANERLVALRQWLKNSDPDRDEPGEAEQDQAPAASAPAQVLLCPSCGQAMRLERTIQPTGRCPP